MPNEIEGDGWECEECGSIYDTEEEAIECEEDCVADANYDEDE